MSVIMTLIVMTAVQEVVIIIFTMGVMDKLGW